MTVCARRSQADGRHEPARHDRAAADAAGALIAAGVAAASCSAAAHPADGTSAGGSDFEIDRGIGLFLAFIAAAAVAAGAFLKYSGKDPDTAAPGSGPATPF